MLDIQHVNPPTLPELLMMPWTALSKSSVREKRAYSIGDTVHVYWFDAWCPREPFIPCGVLTRTELRQLQ